MPSNWKEIIQMAKTINHKFMPWIEVSRTDSKIHEKTGWKIHVSIHPDDYDKIIHILEVIGKYRDEHGIGAKFAVKGWAEEMLQHETQRGKTITIYVPEEKAEVAPQLIRDIERVIKDKRVKTHQPAPNDVILGETGAIGITYAQFGGGDIAVPKEWQHIYGGKIEDNARRRDPRLAVPLWKRKEFMQLFGKIPENIALYKALRKAGMGEREAFEAMRRHALSKNAHHVWKGEKVEMKPGDVLTINKADILRLTAPGAKTESTVAPYILLHGGYRSGMGGKTYVLSGKGYVKIAEDGSTVAREARLPIEHLHEDPHIIIERAPGILRIHNVGKKPIHVARA